MRLARLAWSCEGVFGGLTPLIIGQDSSKLEQQNAQRGVGALSRSAAAVVALTLKAPLVARGSDGVEAIRVYATPGRLTLRVEKVATPFTASSVAVPASVPPFGSVPIVSVTLPITFETG
jgi:hypothetical protein